VKEGAGDAGRTSIRVSSCHPNRLINVYSEQEIMFRSKFCIRQQTEITSKSLHKTRHRLTDKPNLQT